jgi:hypothetical protein
MVKKEGEGPIRNQPLRLSASAVNPKIKSVAETILEES